MAPINADIVAAFNPANKAAPNAAAAPPVKAMIAAPTIIATAPIISSTACSFTKSTTPCSTLPRTSPISPRNHSSHQQIFPTNFFLLLHLVLAKCIYQKTFPDLHLQELRPEHQW